MAYVIGPIARAARGTKPIAPLICSLPSPDWTAASQGSWSIWSKQDVADKSEQLAWHRATAKFDCCGRGWDGGTHSTVEERGAGGQDTGPQLRIRTPFAPSHRYTAASRHSQDPVPYAVASPGPVACIGSAPMPPSQSAVRLSLGPKPNHCFPAPEAGRQPCRTPVEIEGQKPLQQHTLRQWR